MGNPPQREPGVSPAPPRIDRGAQTTATARTPKMSPSSFEGLKLLALPPPGGERYGGHCPTARATAPTIAAGGRNRGTERPPPAPEERSDDREAATSHGERSEAGARGGGGGRAPRRRPPSPAEGKGEGGEPALARRARARAERSGAGPPAGGGCNPAEPEHSGPAGRRTLFGDRPPAGNATGGAARQATFDRRE